MPWKDGTVMSKKEKFILSALQKTMPFSALCKEFNISRECGYIPKKVQESVDLYP